MTYLIQSNIWCLVVALVIGFAIGAWIWARPRHRVELAAPAEDAPLARTLERAPQSPASPPAHAEAEHPAPHVAFDVRPADPVHNQGTVVSDDLASPFLAAPQGEIDDFRRLKGVGPKLNALLGELGVYHYHQIAAWTDGHVAIVDERLGSFKGRIERDRWREQARLLAEGRFDEFEEKFGSGAKS